MQYLKLFCLFLEIYAGGEEFRKKFKAAQALRPLSSCDCADQLEICGRVTEGMSHEGKSFPFPLPALPLLTLSLNSICRWCPGGPSQLECRWSVGLPGYCRVDVPLALYFFSTAKKERNILLFFCLCSQSW